MRVLNAVTRTNVALYKASGGRVAGKINGAPVLLLDHVGRKSGQKRTTPLMYTPDGDDLVIVGSRAGSNSTPAWWLNLRDSPRTRVRVGGETRQVVAREAAPEEYERLWDLSVANYADFALYRTRTDRHIPVIVLERA
jgi:F420H(2)-dependent quinone reductase